MKKEETSGTDKEDSRIELLIDLVEGMKKMSQKLEIIEMRLTTHSIKREMP